MAEAAHIAHLLRRTEFVVRPERLAALTPMSISDAVDDVLNISLNGNPQLPAYFQSEDTSSGWNQYVAACSWWLDAMVDRPRPFQEKMTLFWHGHFVSAWWDVGKGYHMMLQTQLYRQHALGNYRELTQQMAIQPAMLVYLSNAVNVKGEPNQNFARELMELFLLGVGHYTEDDVDAAARAWTGHNALWPAYVYQFRSNKHDYGVKRLFGVDYAWDGPDVINAILRDNAEKRVVAAKFITKKLWEFLAYPSPAQSIVDELAAQFLAADLSLTVLLGNLLKRPEFYSAAAMQGMVRTPIEYMAALCYHSGISPEELGVAWRGESTGQQMFQPPNVSGWRHNAYWLNTSALSGRAGMARTVTWFLRRNGGFDNLHGMTVSAAVDFVANYFGITSMSTTTRNALIAAHQAERSAQNWNSYWSPTNLLTMTMLAPEFHMA